MVRYVRNLDFWYYCNQRDGSDGLPSVTHFISRQGRYDIFSPSPPEVCEVRYWVGEFLKYWPCWAWTGRIRVRLGILGPISQLAESSA